MQRARCPVPSPLGTRASRTFRSELRCDPAPPAGRKVLGPPPRFPRPRRLRCRFLMRVLGPYGDDYRSQPVHHRAGGELGRGREQGPGARHASTCPFSRLPGRGQPGHRCSPPRQCRNEPPEKEGLSPPEGTPARPQSQAAPAPARGPAGEAGGAAPGRRGRRGGAALTPELAPVRGRGKGEGQGAQGKARPGLRGERRPWRGGKGVRLAWEGESWKGSAGVEKEDLEEVLGRRRDTQAGWQQSRES